MHNISIFIHSAAASFHIFGCMRVDEDPTYVSVIKVYRLLCYSVVDRFYCKIQRLYTKTFHHLVTYSDTN